jgi:heme/copper-type cytochrome/quinol oxidase subunit 1
VLSMGAVFALFAGFYHWVVFLTGYAYLEIMGKIHFWVTFVGVNLTFFPMHFLGLAGMPRRIPDYPDAYAFWNSICSWGSYISVLGLIIFFVLIYQMLSGYAWMYDAQILNAIVTNEGRVQYVVMFRLLVWSRMLKFFKKYFSV